MNKYYCPKCHKIVERDSDKRWIKGFCSTSEKMSRLFLIHNKMTGLQKILKRHYKMTIKEGDKEVVWVWDYTNNAPRRWEDMTTQEKRKNTALRRKVEQGTL